MAKKFYVIDTSVFLSDAGCLFKFENNDIIIPIKVLEEIDKHKKRQDSVGFNARMIIKHLDNLREKGSLASGVRIDKGKGILQVVSATSELPRDLDPTIPDNEILASAIKIKEDNPKKKVIVVSRDINIKWLMTAINCILDMLKLSLMIK
jgi:PhoH-like ATPase